MLARHDNLKGKKITWMYVFNIVQNYSSPTMNLNQM